MLSRILIGLVAAGAAVIGRPVWRPPNRNQRRHPHPNANAFTPVTPSDFTMQNGEIYAFTVPDGVNCLMSRGSGSYGCTGPIPAAPGGATVVTGSQQGTPGFATADRPIYVFDTPPKALPAGSRISFRNVTCGTDGVTAVCNNSFDGAGFVLSPAGSFIIGPTNPLLLNEGEGHNPYFN